MYWLATCYRYGWGCDQNDNKAVEWFEKSASLGYSEAMDYLGNIYRFGRSGVTIDLNKARDWYTKAAAQGRVTAQEALDALDNPDDNE